MNDTQWHVEIGSVGQVNSITAFCSQPHLASFFKRTGLPRTCRQSPNTAYWNFRHQKFRFQITELRIHSYCDKGKVGMGRGRQGPHLTWKKQVSGGKGSGGLTRSGLSSQIQEPIIAQPFVEPTA